MVLAQHPPPCGRSVLLKLAGALEVTQIPEGRGEVVHRGEVSGWFSPSTRRYVVRVCSSSVRACWC